MHCICSLLVRARARSSYTDLQARLVQAYLRVLQLVQAVAHAYAFAHCPFRLPNPFSLRLHSRPCSGHFRCTALAQGLGSPAGLKLPWLDACTGPQALNRFCDRMAGRKHSARRQALGLSFFWGCPHVLWTSPGGRGWSHKILPRPSVLASKKQNHYGRVPQKLSPRPCSFSFCHPPRVEELLATGWEYTVASVAMGLGCPALCGPAASPGAGWAARLSAVLAFSM